MNKEFNKIKNSVESVSFLFSWVRFFYPKSKGIHLVYLLYFYVPQKLFRINGSIPWPVHFTSRILFHKKIAVGNRTAPGMNANCYVQARNGIHIGSNFRMGPGVGLISANHKENDYDMHTENRPITIGDNVWIGMNTVVLPGVTIGDNVMIGANSVVTKEIPPNVVAAGNPCRVIRQKEPYQGVDYTKL